MKKILMLVLAVGILVSCRTKPKDNSTPVTKAIENSSSTPSSTATINLPSTLTPTQRSTLTFQPARATVEAAIESCGQDYPQNRYINRSLSPSGKWTAVVCQDNGVYTKVSRIDGSNSWQLPVFEVAESLSGPDWYLVPYLWSRDEQYLYLIPQIMAGVDCPICFPVNGFGLYRLDLSTGNLDTWFNPDFPGYNFSFSPDENFFVFTDPNNHRVVRIRELSSGKERSLSFKKKYSGLGQFVWSNDNINLIIVACLDGWYDDNAGCSIFLYNLADRSLKVLIDNDKRNLFPATGYDYETRLGSPWQSDDMLLLGDPIWGGDAWTLNIRNGELFPYSTPVVFPTSTP